MTKQLLFAYLLILAGSAFAETETVLSMQTVKVAGIEVSVPKTQETDGTVCQSYISKSTVTTNESHEDSTKVTIDISKVCDKPAKLINEIGGQEIFPAKLASMKFVPMGDMGIHLIEIRQ